MDRRKFIKTSALAAVSAPLLGAMPLEAKPNNTHEAKADAIPGADLVPLTDELKIRFLGTGAADWDGPDERGEHRRLTSILVNDKFLVDFTSSDADMLPKDCKPEVIFYTHSHGDHFSASAALSLGIKKVYLGATWADRARQLFTMTAEAMNKEVPEIIPLEIGGRYIQDGLVLTALPGDHVTSNMQEQALIYLIESTSARVLYATDTAGIMGKAARLAGIDAHTSGKPITGLIMEATMGMEHTLDYRIFNHSSVAMVQQAYEVLNMTERYTPKPGTSVYLTHLARTLHDTQAELDATLPAPLKAAYDGLEVNF